MSEKYYGVTESDWRQHKAIMQWDRNIRKNIGSFLSSCAPVGIDADIVEGVISQINSDLRINTHDYNQFDLCEVKNGEFKWLMRESPKEKILALYYDEEPMTMVELENELDRYEPGMLSEEDRRRIRECG